MAGYSPWVVGAFPVSLSPLLSSHHLALTVFALPVVPVIPGVTHIPRKGEGRGSWACSLSFSLGLSLCSSALYVTWQLRAVGLLSADGGGMETVVGVLTGGAGDVASRSKVGTTMGGRDGGGGGEESSDVSRLGRISRFGRGRTVDCRGGI